MVQHYDHRSTKLFCCTVYLMNEVLWGQNLVLLQSTLLRMRNARHHYWHGNLQPRPPMAPPTNLNSRWCPMGQPLLPSSECWARRVLADVYSQQLCRMCWISAFQLVLVIVFTACVPWVWHVTITLANCNCIDIWGIVEWVQLSYLLWCPPGSKERMWDMSIQFT